MLSEAEAKGEKEGLQIEKENTFNGDFKNESLT
jgi:hypothetical protein